MNSLKKHWLLWLLALLILAFAWFWYRQSTFQNN
jgi:hypothetical protein